MDQYPVDVQYRYPERSSRWLALATLLFLVPKAVLLVPHLFIMYILGIAAMFCGIAAQVVVLVTGTYPHGLFDFMTGLSQWQTRVNAYLIGLTDQYPPFRMRP
ncbi:MAG TPA: DUF4389 domain-containing protein [Candidatus Paceibacterota bacterium]|nr:DUF4389 domain-containing protein [Candidatus Paceibacterota bacterium]